jgi:metal-responsive CopG/Arc/MetJ family transcriptional regulator
MVMRTTINVDEKIWKEFELEVIRRYGNCRSRKKALEEAIRSWTAGGKR